MINKNSIEKTKLIFENFFALLIDLTIVLLIIVMLNITIFVYDENGQLIQKTDEDGNVTEYTYNSRNLISVINYSNEKKVVFEYNKEGKLIEAKDWLGSTKFELDLLNRIVGVNDHNDKTVKYKYDEVGNQVEVIYPDNTSTKYKYDILNNVSEIVESNGDVSAFEYDKLGRVTLIKYPNELKEVYEYNKLGQIVKTKAINGVNEHILNIYEYDPQGNIINELKGGMNDNEKQSITYKYDELNRLVSSVENNGLFEKAYKYDSLGNMVHEINGQNEIGYQIDNLNRLTSKKVVGIENANINEIFNYAYDNRGNLIRESQEKDGHNTTVLSYDYDVTNKMVGGTNKYNISSIYKYNGLGVLVGNEIKNGIETINNLEPKVNTPTIDKKVSKQFTIDYTNLIPSDLMEEYSDGVSMKYAYVGRHKLSAEIRISEKQEQEKLYYHKDRLGSSVFVTDINGTVKASANFDEWGNRDKYNIVKLGDKDIDLVKSYTGHNYDEVLGVYYAKARMYNSKDKRFLAEDTVKGEIGNTLSLVPYGYVIGNPLKYIDPDGLYYIVEEMKFMKPTGKYIVLKDNWLNQTVKWTAQLVPFAGGFLSDNIDSVTSSTMNTQGIHYRPVGGTSFTQADGNKYIEEYLMGNFQDELIETIGKEGLKQLAKEMISIYDMVDTASDALDRAEILDYDDKIFKIIDISGNGTTFKSRDAAIKTMTNYTKLIDSRPDYFKDASIDLGFIKGKAIPFCLDYEVYKSKDKNKKIEALAENFADARYGYIYDPRKKNARTDFKNYMKKYDRRLEEVKKAVK